MWQPWGCREGASTVWPWLSGNSFYRSGWPQTHWGGGAGGAGGLAQKERDGKEREKMRVSLGRWLTGSRACHTSKKTRVQIPRAYVNTG